MMCTIRVLDFDKKVGKEGLTSASPESTCFPVTFPLVQWVNVIHEVVCDHLGASECQLAAWAES